MGGRFSLFLLFLQEINSKRHRGWRGNPRFSAVRRCAEQQKASAVFRCFVYSDQSDGRTDCPSDPVGVIPHGMHALDGNICSNNLLIW
jgi:hypothetical protein